jgi:hypothetical protein
MGYVLRSGKLVKRERLRTREPKREPIKTSYHRELWAPGPVAEMARSIAKIQFMKELRAKGRDPKDVTSTELDNGVTVLLFNSGDYYLNKAKEALR